MNGATTCGRRPLARRARAGAMAAGFLAVALLPRCLAAQSLSLSVSPSTRIDQGTFASITATLNGSAPSCSSDLFPPCWTWTVTQTNGVSLQPSASSDGSASASFSSTVTPGTFTVSVSRYGVATAGSVQITVNPMRISLSGQQQIPQGESATITATITGIEAGSAGALNWSLSGGGTVAGSNACIGCPQQTATVTAGTTAGQYLLTAQSVLEPSVSASLPITVLPPPAASISPASVTVAAGQAVVFTGAAANTSDPNITMFTNDRDAALNQDSATTWTYQHIAGQPGGTFYVQASSERGGTTARAPVTVVNVTIAPAAIVVQPGSSRQFLAEVTGSQQATQWSTTIPGAALSPAGLLQVPAGTATGTYTVTVQTVGAPVATAAAAVTVDASIPITGVVVSPARSVMDSAQQEQLTALVLSQNGEPNANQAVFWNVSGPSPAFISASGVFTSPAMPGIYTVTATSAAAQVSGTATIDVGENLMITPSSASLPPGASVTFTAQVSDTRGAPVTWSLEEGAAGGTITAAGVYTAPAAFGTYHVLAVASSEGVPVQGVATVVVPNQLAAPPPFTVSPSEVTVAAGGQQQFTAVTAGGAAAANITWSATAGTIDSTGLFTAPADFGTVTVTAVSQSSPNPQSSATVIVESSAAGQGYQYDANGNLLSDGTRTFEWDAENRLTAINQGTHRSEFGYDGQGRRVLITERDNGAVTTSQHSLWVGDQLVEQTDATADPTAGASPPTGGSFGSLDCNQLAGWAWNAAQPNTPVAVDIYVGSVKMATVLANTYRNDLKHANVGNGDHGFTYPTPAAAKTGSAQTVSVDLAGTTTAIGSRSVTCAAPAFGGSFGEADCNQLAGWVWDANQPNSPIDVDVYDGSTLIATALAGTFRQDLLSAGIGNGDHGFFIPTPASLKTGAAHSVTIKIGGTQTVIGTRSLTCASPAFAGSLDQADCTQLAGWAWDANQPNDAVNVDIYAGATLLATVPAATFRQDLQNAGIGNGHHGFTYSTEALYTGTTESLAAYVSGTTIQLASSPRTATCPTEPILTRFFPGGMQSGATPYYFSYDHLGSLREVTDASGNVVSRYDYDPYGRLTINQGTPPPFGFAHYYYHAPSGLSLTKFRAYDPNLGRWESRDPLPSLNSYNYALNNPVAYLDPDGRVAVVAAPLVVLAVVTVVVVVVYEVLINSPAGKAWQHDLQQPTLWPDPSPPAMPAPDIGPGLPPAIPPSDISPDVPPFPIGEPIVPLPIPMGPRDRPVAPGRGCPPPQAYPGQRPRVTPPPTLRPAHPEDNRTPNPDPTKKEWRDFVEHIGDLLDWFASVEGLLRE